MCEYLYAQFSLKRGPDEGLTDGQLARVQAWEKTLITVIKQEMLHLALATNILTAIGAAPHFERPNFPILSRWYPPGVQIALAPFGERALRHFIYLERPEGMALDDAAGFAAARHAQPLTAAGAGLVAVPEPWQTVGHLYRGIEAGLAALCARLREVPDHLAAGRVDLLGQQADMVDGGHGTLERRGGGLDLAGQRLRLPERAQQERPLLSW
ncbi:MAG TPA: ferritin-like domain-containing protein [Streptosporangiaceae bacterium]